MPQINQHADFNDLDNPETVVETRLSMDGRQPPAVPLLGHQAGITNDRPSADTPSCSLMCVEAHKDDFPSYSFLQHPPEAAPHHEGTNRHPRFSTTSSSNAASIRTQPPCYQERLPQDEARLLGGPLLVAE